MKVGLTLTLCVMMVGILGLAITTQSQEEVAFEYAGMIEEIEVMSRVIDRTLEGAFEKNYLGSSLFGRRGCQGFYLNGYGAVFLVNVQFAVTDKQLTLVEKEDSSDLWDQVQREVRRQPGKTEAEWTPRVREHDEQQVSQLKSTVATLVSKYGSRMNHLKPGEKISIVVRGGSARVILDSTRLTGGAFDVIESTDDGQRTMAIVRRSETEADESIAMSMYGFSTGVASDRLAVRPGEVLPTSTLVLTFTKELIQDASALSPQELLDRADVMQY